MMDQNRQAESLSERGRHQTVGSQKLNYKLIEPRGILDIAGVTGAGQHFMDGARDQRRRALPRP